LREYNAKTKDAQKEYRIIHKDILSKHSKEYYKNNKKHILNTNKKYRELNKEKLNENARIYKYNKYHTDPLYKLKQTCRRRLNAILTQSGYSKCSRTFYIIGCLPKDLKEHLEKLFQKGMSWENHGKSWKMAY